MVASNSKHNIIHICVRLLFYIQSDAVLRNDAMLKWPMRTIVATRKSDYVNLCMAYINVTMIYLKGNLKFEGIACSF